MSAATQATSQAEPETAPASATGPARAAAASPAWRATLRGWAPWRDRRGRISALHAAAFAAVVLPGLWLALALGGAFGPMALGAEPIHMAEHLTGTWALRFLLASLAISPLRRLLGWSRLLQVRRMIGLAAFGYVAVHFALYVVEQHFHLDRVASEIVSRLYLAIGFVGLLGLGALAATSFDRAIRRMGPAWRRLHRLAYPLALLGLTHFALQEKLDISQPALLFGLFAALMLHRAWDRGAFPEARVALIALAAAGLTAAAEWAWYDQLTGLPAARILAANLDLGAQRPALLVALAAAAPLVVLLARRAQGALPRRAGA